MLNAVYKLAASNKNQLLSGFRLFDGSVMATNIVTDVCLPHVDFTGLNCYVNAKAFITATNSTKNIKIKQSANSITFKDGDYEIEVPTLNVEDFPAFESRQENALPISS